MFLLGAVFTGFFFTVFTILEKLVIASQSGKNWQKLAKTPPNWQKLQPKWKKLFFVILFVPPKLAKNFSVITQVLHNVTI